MKTLTIKLAVKKTRLLFCLAVLASLTNWRWPWSVAKRFCLEARPC